MSLRMPGLRLQATYKVEEAISLTAHQKADVFAKTAFQSVVAISKSVSLAAGIIYLVILAE